MGNTSSSKRRQGNWAGKDIDGHRTSLRRRRCRGLSTCEAVQTLVAQLVDISRNAHDVDGE